MSAGPVGCSVAVVGAGGHAAVVVSMLLMSDERVEFCVSERREDWGKDVLGVPVVGGLEELTKRQVEGAVIAIGSNDVRRRIARELRCRWVNVVHPGAWIHESVELGVGCVICAGAVVQPRTVVGSHVIVNTGATVDHDCRVGDFVHVGPGASVAGGVGIGEGALLGVGTSVIPGCEVGAGAVVGAGAAVTRPVPAGMTVVGVPAKLRD